MFRAHTHTEKRRSTQRADRQVQVSKEFRFYYKLRKDAQTGQDTQKIISRSRDEETISIHKLSAPTHRPHPS